MIHEFNEFRGDRIKKVVCENPNISTKKFREFIQY